jgi:PAS domain S-box-containing protein
LNILHKNTRQLEDIEKALSESSILSRTDNRGIITSVNPNFVSISKYTENELLGQNHNIINSGYHPKKFWATMWRTIAKGRSWRGDVCNKAKDGSLYWVDTFIYPYSSSQSGKPTEYFSVRNDVTAKKNYEAEVTRQNEILRLIAWKQSHEVRRPVANILGVLNLLENKLSHAIDERELMRHLRLSANELDDIIRSIVRLTEEAEDLCPLKVFKQ